MCIKYRVDKYQPGAKLDSCNRMVVRVNLSSVGPLVCCSYFWLLVIWCTSPFSFLRFDVISKIYSTTDTKHLEKKSCLLYIIKY